MSKEYPMERTPTPRKNNAPRFNPLAKRVRGFANAAEFEGFVSERDEDERRPMKKGFVPTRNPFKVGLWR